VRAARPSLGHASLFSLGDPRNLRELWRACISGYLITTLLLKEHQRTGCISLKDFYVRRAYRILPAAYAFMLVAMVAEWHTLSWANLLAALTYLSNYCHGGSWTLGHLWSLSVEEQFYLL